MKNLTFQLKQTEQTIIDNYLIKQQALKAMELLFVDPRPYNEIQLPKLLKKEVYAETM